MKLNVIGYLVLLISWIGVTSAFAEKIHVDQVPMYGGMDRQSVPDLKKADEDLIENATAEFGDRSTASKAWVEQGFRYYSQSNYTKAMQRFNQAWLLDPKNPEVYFGFGSVLHDKGNNCGAYEMLDRAHSLGVEYPGFLADLGRVSTLCAVDGRDETERQRLIQKSINLYETALKQAPNDRTAAYVMASWASAHYWQGNYESAWEMVRKVEALGGAVPVKFRSALASKMVEPE